MDDVKEYEDLVARLMAEPERIQELSEGTRSLLLLTVVADEVELLRGALIAAMTELDAMGKRIAELEAGR